jgi:hypothetical protein
MTCLTLKSLKAISAENPEQKDSIPAVKHDFRLFFVINFLYNGHKESPETTYLSHFRASRALKNRGDWIRTSGLHVPNVALYQTEPHLDMLYSFFQNQHT